MRQTKLYFRKQNQFALLFTVMSLLSGCSGSGKETPSEVPDVEFKTQDFPVNSALYVYEDSASLKQSMASLRLEPGLRIELVAAEPLVVDPVAFAFDEDQVMYVVENRGYPDPAEGGSPTRLGRIARLEDRDGDGRFDHRTEFATGLTYPNGILPWKGGVFVTCAPDIYYFKDTDGDGIADVQKVVLTGFNSDKTAQIRVSHPILGLDGWVYVTSGLNGGEVKSPDHPDRPAVSFAAADGRFHPETFEFEMTGGRSQFGLAFDPFGRRFGTSNRHPMQHIVMEPRYLRRNPHLLFNESTENVAKAEAEAVVFPISNAVTSADFIPKLIGLSHKGTFTSACGLLVYQGTGVGHEHVGNAFICEPAQNLVQRQIVEPDGVTFKSRLPYENREFLSSTDTWFNPVFLGEGPEGALYLADMYRKVIDHPSYVPEEAREGLDFESGKDKGRIYRIVAEDFEQGEVSMDYPISSSSESPALVQALASKEEWIRATAHRLLLQRKGDIEVTALEELAEKAALPESRVRALWLLQSLNKLNPEVLEKAMKDKHEGIREQAILLGASLWESSPGLLPLLIRASEDKEIRVRFVAALMLGQLEHPDAGQALARVAAENGEDKWIRAAVLSGIGNRLPEFLEMFRSSPSPDQDAFAAVMQDLGRLFGNAASVQDSQKLFRDVVQDEGELSWRMATALGLVEGFSGRSKMAASGQSPLAALLGEGRSEEDQQLNSFLEEARAMALNERQHLRSRMNATTLLGYAPYEQVAQALQELLDARNAPEIQLASVSALARLGDARGGELLTSQQVWTQYTPRVKAAAIQALVSNPVFVQTLFAAIAQGTIRPAEISSTYRQRLLNDKDKKVSEQAEALFKELEGGGRMQVYQAYREVLNLPTEPSLGKAVFQTHCSACHTYAGEGGKVGPDLTGVNNQPADALLLHTLVPNYEVLPSYQSVAVETNDGRSLNGYLLSETDNSLTLRTAFGTEEAVLRSNIISIHNSGLSLMPDGLEQSMTKEELANLIAYLKQGS
jgi:putative membrane-bound dehydrogenase-like protein